MFISLIIVQALGMLPFAISQDADTKLATPKTNYPDAWFYTCEFNCLADFEILVDQT